MTLFRMMRRVVPILVGLFVVAQFSGVVPRLAYAQPAAKAAAHVQHIQQQHAQDHADHSQSKQHYPDDQHGNIADQCCALHLLTGVVPLVVTAFPIDLASQPLSAAPSGRIAGIGTSPLFRPPRTR